MSQKQTGTLGFLLLLLSCSGGNVDSPKGQASRSKQPAGNSGKPESPSPILTQSTPNSMSGSNAVVAEPASVQPSTSRPSENHSAITLPPLAEGNGRDQTPESNQVDGVIPPLEVSGAFLTCITKDGITCMVRDPNLKALSNPNDLQVKALYKEAGRSAVEVPMEQKRIQDGTVYWEHPVMGMNPYKMDWMELTAVQTRDSVLRKFKIEGIGRPVVMGSAFGQGESLGSCVVSEEGGTIPDGELFDYELNLTIEKDKTPVVIGLRGLCGVSQTKVGQESVIRVLRDRNVVQSWKLAQGESPTDFDFPIVLDRGRYEVEVIAGTKKDSIVRDRFTFSNLFRIY